MSMVSDVEKMLFECFADGEVHTFEEYNAMAIRLNIIQEDNTSAIRNTVYKLKNNPNFKTVGKGKYIVCAQENKKDNDNGLTVEEAFDFLSKRLKRIKKMDVIKNSYEELQRGKKEVEIYDRYVSEFNKCLSQG